MARIDGKALAAELLQKFKKDWPFHSQRPPGLTVIQVGDDPASSAYIRGKENAARSGGITFEHLRLARSSSFSQIKASIENVSAKSDVDGLILQLPLDLEHPLKASEVQTLLESIPPEKDADGLHPFNLGRVAGGESSPQNWSSPIPATPLGMMRMLEKQAFSLKGTRSVVIGKSRIVGMPMAMLLSQAASTVTICHRQTPDFSVHTKEANLIVVAAGQKHLLKPEHIRPGVGILDVGIHPTGEARKLTGDMHPDCEKIAAFVSPVPGGVGPMTVAGLIENTLRLYQANFASH
jgi:methylenetetrahydrofolate dehydrogenase (NADP+)/methenyltetrahydrofolate cyclohydrolase